MVVVARSFQLRSRAKGLAVVGPDDRTQPPIGGWSWLTAHGVRIDRDLGEAVTAHAEAEGVDVLDVVPSDLATEDALELLRAYDPATYRTDRLARGVSARRAIAVRTATLDRAGLDPATDAGPIALDLAAVELKRHCNSSMGVAVGPALGTPDTSASQRMELLRSRFGAATPLLVAVPVLGYGFLVVGVLSAPVFGVCALVAWCAQPVLSLAGTALRPADLWRRSSLRWLLGPIGLVRSVLGPRHPASDPRSAEGDARRAEYARELSEGTARFFEPRASECPLCGSQDLAPRLSTTDMVLHKPGRFHLDRCRACGHVFQNPRLSLDGLDFYYRDAYDGLNAERGEAMFKVTQAAYHARADMLDPEARPRRWLDIGTGYGHFPLVAQDHWPDTTFDGLDISDSVDVAARRRWVAEGFRGLLLDRAPDLAGRYDVVSMFHYLEHTRQPVAELDVVASLLTPGGHLLVELPDPTSPYARIAGRYWFPWLQPQHLHFLSRDRVCSLLSERGFEIVSSGPVEAFPGQELAGACWLVINRFAPETGLPWLPPTTARDTLRRVGALAIGAPVLVAAALLDQVLSASDRRLRGSSAFRVVARRP
jgi:SAM-dependent methyltransferase